MLEILPSCSKLTICFILQECVYIGQKEDNTTVPSPNVFFQTFTSNFRTLFIAFLPNFGQTNRTLY